MSPIEVLLSLELPDASIARRLRVSPMTVSRWRTKRSKPYPKHQKTAVAYLSEIQQAITQAITLAAFSIAA